MKTTLRLRLPRLSELQPDSLLDFALTDSTRVLRQGQLALNRVAEGVPAREVVAILHPADAVLAELALPPLPNHQLKAAVAGAIEPLLLGDSETLAIGFGPRASTGKVPVAWADRAWLTRAWHLLAEHQLPVRHLIPAPLALPVPDQGVVLAEHADHLLARQDNGTGHVLALDPLAPEHAPDPAADIWLASLLQPAARFAWVEPVPPRFTHWQPDTDPLAGEAACERAPELPNQSLWVSPLPAWSLALPELRPRQLQKSPWRRPVLWSLAAAGVWLLGLNLYAWQLQREATTLEQRMVSAVQTTFPQVPVVLDPLRQAGQQLNALRQSRGTSSDTDFLPLALAAADLMPANRAAIQNLQYQDGVLTLTFAEAGGADRAALNADVLARAQQLGLQIDDADNQWEIRRRDPADATLGSAGVAITPGAQTARELDRRTGANR